MGDGVTDEWFGDLRFSYYEIEPGWRDDLCTPDTCLRYGYCGCSPLTLAQRRAVVRLRLEELLLLDTNAASAAAVAKHLKRYADALRDVGETMVKHGGTRPHVRSDVCAALEAMPDELQLMVLRHLSDYDVVALLACRKAPCFSERTGRQLLELHPPPTDSMFDPWHWRKSWPHPFDVPYHELCPFRELRRRAYQRGVRSKYGLEASAATAAAGRRCVRWTSLDVPGDTVLVSEVTTRLAQPSPELDDLRRFPYVYHSVCASEDARRGWRNGKPRWFPPLVRVTEQGNPTDGRVGEFAGSCWSRV